MCRVVLHTYTYMYLYTVELEWMVYQNIYIRYINSVIPFSYILPSASLCSYLCSVFSVPNPSLSPRLVLLTTTEHKSVSIIIIMIIMLVASSLIFLLTEPWIGCWWVPRRILDFIITQTHCTGLPIAYYNL